MQALREPSFSSVLVPLQPQSTGDVLLSDTEVQIIYSQNYESKEVFVI